MKRFDASLELLMERIAARDEEMDSLREKEEMYDREKNQMLQAKKIKSIAHVLEEVEAVIDVHFFDEFSKTKSSTFPKRSLQTRV